MTGIEIRWISVRARPIASAAVPASGAHAGGPHDHEQEDRRQHHLDDEAGDQVVATGREVVEAVRREGTGHRRIDVEAVDARRDHEERGRRQQPADHLGRDVGRGVGGREPLAGDQPQRDGRVEVRARDVPERVGAREHREPEGEADPERADALAGEDSRATTAEHQPERAEHLGTELPTIHGPTSTVVVLDATLRPTPSAERGIRAGRRRGRVC